MNKIIRLLFLTILSYTLHADQKKEINQLEEPLTVQEMFKILSETVDCIQSGYVEPVNNRKVLEGALSGIMGSLDPHSVYLTDKQFKEMNEMTTGNFGGLGLELMMQEGLIRIITAIDDTPAFKAGLQHDDLIISINDESVYGMTDIQAIEKMRGQPGTPVKLAIRRNNATFERKIVRALIKSHPVKSRIEKNIGYIRIATFNETTSLELIKAIKDIHKKQGDTLLGYVIDLRNNSGGLLDQAVDVADAFIGQPGKRIVTIKQRNRKLFSEFKSRGFDYTFGRPIIVLINGGSASASEIVAGALQDHKRAVIVGTNSFGKASVQQIIPVKGNGALKMTVAFYYTPLNRSIQKFGIKPDIEVKQIFELKTINANKNLREALLKDSLSESDEFDTTKSESQEEIKKIIKEKNFEDLTDFQLQQAYHILQALNLDKNFYERNASDTRFYPEKFVKGY